MLYNITLILFVITILWIIIGCVGVFHKPSILNKFVATNIYFYTFIILLGSVMILSSILVLK
jgi:multisubunit Na+/H+ antiporter MnhG subunit